MNKKFALFVATLLEEQAELLKKQIEGLRSYANDEEREEHKKEKKKKPAVDPNRPKNPLSGYMLFMQDYSKKLLDDPDYMAKTQTEKFKLLGNMWSELDAESTIKKEYLERGEELKREHAIKLKEYEQNPGKNMNTTSVERTIDHPHNQILDMTTQDIDGKIMYEP